MKTKLLAFLIFSTFSIAANAQKSIQLPNQAIGNCEENNGQGKLLTTPTKNGPMYTFSCHIPLVFVDNFSGGSSELMRSAIRIENSTSQLYNTEIANQGALILGHTGTSYYDSLNGLSIAFFIQITCSTHHKKCSDQLVRDAALLLGDLSQATGQITSARKSSGGYPSTVCLEKGPGFPNGPSCLREASVDSVSGSFCKTPGDYSKNEPSCLEFGNLAPKFP